MRDPLLALLLVALFVALPAGAVTMDWVPIGNPNNPADTLTNCYAANCGSVPYAYYISKYEVTNAEYAEFLNAKAASDPLYLYNPLRTNPGHGITRNGSDGSYTYTPDVGFENKPVAGVYPEHALRFANWLNNGQGSGDTETGAYTINELPATRNPGAITFLPSENEWYKAAYYDPALPGYYDYPAGTDSVTECVTPGSDTGNSANCDFVVGAVTDVGSYGLSPSPYGTFDQGGNVWEWNEEIVSCDVCEGRGLRGGGTGREAGALAASTLGCFDIAFNGCVPGFRVASLVPEPAQVLLVLTGGLVLAAARRRPA